MAKKRYTKVEEEIIQILNEADREPVWRKLRRPRRRPPRQPRQPDRKSSRFDRTLLPLGLSFALALAAVIIGGSSHTLAVVLAIASVLTFLSPIVLRFSPPSRSPASYEWRGKVIDLPPRRAGLLGEIRYRLWQFRHRR